MFLLLLLKACTGEEVLYVSLWACYSGSVGAGGGVWEGVSMGSLVGGFYGLAFLMAVEASHSRQQGGVLSLHERTKSVGLLAEERR